MSRVVKRQGAAGQLDRLFRRVTMAAAKGGAAELQDKLSGAGSGTHHPGQPNPSSAQGEYPAEQSGTLKDSIMPVRLDGTRSAFGSVDGPDYLLALHYKPPGDGGRPFLDDAKHDRTIHRAMLDQVRKEV
ncbi:hypothetical protein WDJ50_18660 (plasmid) [Deinococcus sp. VB142]|uniref:HK97 gp10 family phage protein n=1 Tax=Deinococcus sp. VB142 TaxID=3112952 RepID=A0AAU6Q808_9DEIO